MVCLMKDRIHTIREIFFFLSGQRGRPYLSTNIDTPSMMIGPLGLQQILVGHVSHGFGHDGVLQSVKH